MNIVRVVEGNGCNGEEIDLADIILGIQLGQSTSNAGHTESVRKASFKTKRRVDQKRKIFCEGRGGCDGER